ncbi:hypothetical protein H131_12488 [Lysinibacillus sphaericus OT4b.31]|uniref:Uncharacterized protein n=1 Tax=Lysinibacillus sphaericus OT4b.31 TaxID=1285586 RepID=R7ZED9_LYSSH|nr:hypothetical protein H131_12488 [Lysinibacillus sphaericus OT4b.31]
MVKWNHSTLWLEGEGRGYPFPEGSFMTRVIKVCHFYHLSTLKQIKYTTKLLYLNQMFLWYNFLKKEWFF